MAVGEEDGVELAAFGAAGQFLVIADVAQALHGGARMAPGGTVVAATENEQIQVQHGGRFPDGPEARRAGDMVGLVWAFGGHANGRRTRANLAQMGGPGARPKCVDIGAPLS
ncbi:hypothetical protein D9M68_803290 [compost metagenome]